MAANTSSLTPADRLREETLVSEHLPLVRHLVTDTVRRLPAHVSRDELLSAGLIALAQAARSYDESRGVPFGRFAATRVRGALIDELRSSDWASRSVRRRARERDAAEEALTATLGRTPTPAEIATALGVSRDEVGAVEEDVQRALVLSLQGFSETFGVEDHVESHDPAPEEVLLHREQIGYLHDAVAVLPDRLRTVVEQYFFEERPMTEIAEQLGVSESRVSQMRAEALALLKDGLNAQLDPEMVSQPARPDGCAARRRGAYYAAVAARGTLRSRLAVGAEAVVA
jgi:RNA polymerase sigma factor for flagellar operon FliA